MKHSLIIGWLYPELMSTYGDRGNIIVLEKRCKWRGIGVTILPVGFTTTSDEMLACSLVFGGGAQDRQQKLVVSDLRKNKREVLRTLFKRGVPGLFVCGAPQLLGHFYMTGDGNKLEGLGLFDMESRHFGTDKPRCIGNLAGELSAVSFQQLERKTVVGFENHGGRTYLGKGVVPFAKITKGSGNNGEDGTEGAVWNNCIATYSHGPFLPKNPHIADWLIAKALEVKYKKPVPLEPLDDTQEWAAHDAALALPV